MGLITAALIPLLLAPAPVKMPFLIGAEWNQGASQATKDLFFETGSNYVRLTGGGYGWSGELHLKALQELQPRGIKALLQLGSHWPDGKYLDRKQDYFVDDQGQAGQREGWGVGYGGQFWPQMSYASKGYRKELEADFKSYLDSLRSFRNVNGLLLHNEPGYFWLDGRIFDYNPQAIAMFREWLPTQHASIDVLNRRWGTSFGSFSEVEPPRERPPVASIASWMDWRRFNMWLIKDFLKWESDFAKRIRPDLPNMTNLAGPLDNWFPLRLADNYGFASASDVACVDIYATDWTTRFFPGFAMDMTRGVAQGRPVVVAECESYDPKGFTKLNEEQLGDRLKSDLWTYIGHGARGILIWSLSGQDGFVLTRGEFNSRIAALRETAHIAKMVGLDNFSRPRTSVAIYVDQDAFLYLGGIYPKLEGGALAQRSLQGIYAALVQQGYEVEIICADDVRAGKAAAYKAMVMATPAVIDKPLTDALFKYVKDGGHLIAEAPFAMWDRWGAPSDWKMLALATLFGAIPPRPMSPINWGVRGVATMTGAERFADGTTHRLGKGTAVLLDRNVGLANAEGTSKETRDLFGILLGKAKLPQRATVLADGFVDCTSLVDSLGNRLVVLTNPTDKKEPPTVKRNVRLAVPTVVDRAFLFGSARSSKNETNPTVWAGAKPLPTAIRDGRTHMQLAELRAATPILLVKDHAPLLAIESPATFEKGKPAIVKVTVFNTSSSTVVGSVDVVAPNGWKVSSQRIKVFPGTFTTYNLALTPVEAAERAVLKPELVISSGRKVVGLPVDVAVRNQS